MSPQLDWKAEYAYTTGMQAFIYGFPYIYNAKLRHDWVTQARDPAVVPYAAVNHFWHAARVMDAPTGTAAARTTTRCTRWHGWTWAANRSSCPTRTWPAGTSPSS